MDKEIDIKEIERILENDSFEILKGEYDSLAIILEPIIERKLFLKAEKGNNFELLAYLKLKLNKNLESFYYAMESYKSSKNSIAILIAAMVIIKIRKPMSGRFINKYKKAIEEALESNKLSEKSFQDIMEFSKLKQCLRRLNSIEEPIKKKEFSYIEKVGYYEIADSNIEIKSYKSEAMINIHLLRVGDKYLILDCGAEMIGDKVVKADLETFLKDVPKENIVAAIISHGHLDHYGSLDLIYQYVDKVYMGEDTYNIISMVTKENLLERNKISFCQEYLEFTVGDFKITAIPNGHILGSMAFFISINGKNIFYTGDFCFSNQNTVSGLRKKDLEIMIKEKGEVDYLITESTYGHKEEWLTYNQRKDLLKIFIENSYRLGVKVFIPAFAIGRAQECHSIINESDSMYLLVDGLAKRITDYYNKYSISSNLITRRTLNSEDETIDEKYNKSPIIIASSGMLQSGSSAMKYYNKVLEDKEMVTVIKCGYMDQDTMNFKLKSKDGINLNLIEINLSAHGQYDEIIELIERIKPKNLVMVHGEGIEEVNDRLCINK